MTGRSWMYAAALCVLAAITAQAHAQMSRLPSGGPVVYLYPEQASVPAGKPATLVLHFRIGPGLHINSHTPHQDYLIPTVLTLADGSSIQLQKTDYPVGTDITLPADPKTRLNVYTGSFTIEAHIIAPRGEHMLQGKLHYQACNEAQCLPPRDAAVAIDLVGK